MKKYRFVFALSFSLFVLGACGETEIVEPTSTEPTTTTTEPEPEPLPPLEITDTF